jgi:hypothetical protein
MFSATSRRQAFVLESTLHSPVGEVQYMAEYLTCGGCQLSGVTSVFGKYADFLRLAIA